MERTLIQLIQDASRRNPDKAYAYRKVSNEWHTTTYGAMETQAQ